MSLEQRPIIIIDYTGTSSRYIAMSTPDLTEWVPRYVSRNLRYYRSYVLAVDFIVLDMSLLVTSDLLPLRKCLFTYESVESF